MKNTMIVEVEGFEGEFGTIAVGNDRAEAGIGHVGRLYCVAEVDESGATTP